MRRGPRVVAVIVLAVVAVWAGAYLFRDALATRAFAFAADHLASVRCSHADVRISASLSRIYVGPLDCEISDKPLHRVRTESDAVISMGAIGIDEVHVERATVDYKERDLSKVASNTLGDVAALIGVSDKLVKSLLDASEMYSSSSPPVRIDSLTMQRAGKTSAVMHDFSKRTDGVWEQTYSARVESGPIEIRAFDMHATPGRGKLTGKIFLGTADSSANPGLPLLLEGSKLDTQQPHVTLSIR